MKYTFGQGSAIDVRLPYAAAVIIVIIGYLLVFRPYDEAIGNERQVADAARVAAETNVNRARHRGDSERQKHLLDRKLHEIDVRSDRTTIVARFVHDLDDIGRRDHVMLLSLSSNRTQADANAPAAARAAVSPSAVSPAAVSSTSTSPSPAAAANAPVATPLAGGSTAGGATGVPIGFEPIALELTLRGEYTHLLQTILRLSDVHVLAQVDVASLKRLHGAHRGQSPELSAVLHVTLFHTVSTGAPPAASPSRLTGVTDARIGSS